MITDEVIEAWMAWARNKPKRRVVFMRGNEVVKRWLDDWDDWFNYFQEYGEWNWYATVEPTNYLEHGVFSRIFIDVDRRDCIGRVLRALDSYGIEYWVLDSGGGFHIYVEFDPTTLGIFYRKLILGFLRDVLGDAFDCIDEQAVKTPSTGRPPFTYNTKYGRRVCLYGAEKCWEKGFIPPVNKWLRDYLLERLVEGEVVRESEEIERVAPDYFFGRGFRDYPKCIQAMITRVVNEGELEHIARVNLASFLIRIGVDVHSVMRFADDYRPWRTQYHVDYIKRGEYLTLSCKRVAMLGYCPYYDRGGKEEMHKCPFYPWLEQWLPDWGELNEDEG